MLFNNEIRPRGKSSIAERPQVISYDSCNEHSIEHCIELRILVEESAEEVVMIAEPEKAAAAFA